MEKSKSVYRQILFLLLIATAVRLVYWHFCPLIAPDGIEYIKLSKLYFSKNITENLDAGSFHSMIYNHPLYPALLGFLNLVIIDKVELLGKVISLVCGLALVLIVYLFTCNIYSKKEGFYAGAIVAFFPEIAFYSQRVLTESLYIFLSTLGVYLGWRALKLYKTKYFIFASLSFAMAYLTKPEGFICFLVFLFLMLFSRLFTADISFKNIIKSYMIVTIIFCCFAVPYIAFLHCETGRWTLSGKIFMGSGGGEFAEIRFDKDKVLEAMYSWRKLNNDNTDFVDSISYEERKTRLAEDDSLLAYLIRTPQKLIKKYLRNLYLEYKNLLPKLIEPVLLIMCGLGFLSVRFNMTTFYLSLYVIAFWGLFYPIIYAPLSRYLLTMIPIIIIWSGKGVSVTQEWLNTSLNSYLQGIRENYFKRLLREYLVIVLVIVCLIPSNINFLRGQFKNRYVAQKEVGLWIKNHLPGNLRIMSWDEFPAYYSRSKWLPLPYAEIPRIVEFAKFKGVKYIVFDEKSKNKFTEKLFDSKNVMLPSINLVHQHDHLSRVLVYKVN